MSCSSLRRTAPLLIPLLCLCLFSAGCSTLQRSPQATQLTDESLAFIAPATAVRIFDATTLVLVNHNFTVALTNERLGLIQTDYVALTALQATLADSLESVGRLRGLEIRVTLNVDERADDSLVQLRASVRRVSGRATADDSVIARYWLEHLADRLSESLDADYERRVTRAMYTEALQGASSGGGAPASGVVRAAAIVMVGLFVATLLSGVFRPGSQ